MFYRKKNIEPSLVCDDSIHTQRIYLAVHDGGSNYDAPGASTDDDFGDSTEGSEAASDVRDDGEKPRVGGGEFNRILIHRLPIAGNLTL